MLVLEKVIDFINSELESSIYSRESTHRNTDDDIYFSQQLAAHKVGYYEPFTLDQIAMNNILKENEASRDLIEKTWAFYHNCLQGSTPTLS